MEELSITDHEVDEGGHQMSELTDIRTQIEKAVIIECHDCIFSPDSAGECLSSSERWRTICWHVPQDLVYLAL